MIEELHANKPATGFDQVYYPGELMEVTKAEYEKSGIPIPEDIMEYLKSDTPY